MGKIIYTISTGLLPITVKLIGSDFPSVVHHNYGQYFFDDVPDGIYVLKAIGADFCENSISITISEHKEEYIDYICEETIETSETPETSDTTDETSESTDETSESTETTEETTSIAPPVGGIKNVYIDRQQDGCGAIKIESPKLDWLPYYYELDEPIYMWALTTRPDKGRITVNDLHTEIKYNILYYPTYISLHYHADPDTKEEYTDTVRFLLYVGADVAIGTINFIVSSCEETSSTTTTTTP